MHARLVQQTTPTRRAFVVALLLALVLAQTLGWMHRALHGEASERARHGTVVAAAAGAQEAEASHAGALHDLFGSHAEPTDCRLFDVLGQPGCAPAALLVLPVLLPAAYLARTLAGFIARRATLFDARGPPASR